MLGCSRRSWLIAVWILVGLAAVPAGAQERAALEKRAQLKVIEIKESDGQILSYRHDSASTDVRMRGTGLAQDARIQMKVGGRPGFTEIDINRGDITGLKPAQQFGKDFLTYVLWAVSVDGRASNLGEITFEGDRAISINVTTQYQTFWLMVTAEPDYAVVDPSPQVILYSARESGVNEPLEREALTLRGGLFYFTHYTAYDSAAAAVERMPNELLQARKAVELATKSSVQPGVRPTGVSEETVEEHAGEALKLARTFLVRAEDAYQKNPGGSEVVQYARTAAQIAENARALAVGAVGDVLFRDLENELAGLRTDVGRFRGDLSSRQAELKKVRAELAARQAELKKLRGDLAGRQAEMSQLRTDLAEVKAKLSKSSSQPPPPVETKPAPPPPALVTRPIVWVGFFGWVVALLLLFRRHSV